MSEIEGRYSAAAASRLTGVSAHCLRAWERRYGAVRPVRTPGGARRYSEREVQRLRLLRRVVSVGHPISEVAGLDDGALSARLAGTETETPPADLRIEEMIEAARALDVDRIDSHLARQLAALGVREFTREVALPLLRRVGEEWEAGRLAPTGEHAISATLRSLLGDTLRRETSHAEGPRLLFSTPAGEHHELGSLIAAAYSLGFGARAVFLGANLPAEELAAAAIRTGASAIAIGLAGLDAESARREAETLRRLLPTEVALWAGGPGAEALRDLPGIRIISRLEEIESHVRSIH